MMVVAGTKRIPFCHSSGQSCPSESCPIGNWRAGTTMYRRNDSMGFFFSPVTIILLQKIRRRSFYQFCIHFIRIYRLLWSSARVRNELLTNHRRDIKTQGEGRWTRQGWIIPCLMWSDIFSLSHNKIKEIGRVRKSIAKSWAHCCSHCSD